MHERWTNYIKVLIRGRESAEQFYFLCRKLFGMASILRSLATVARSGVLAGNGNLCTLGLIGGEKFLKWFIFFLHKGLARSATVPALIRCKSEAAAESRREYSTWFAFVELK